MTGLASTCANVPFAPDLVGQKPVSIVLGKNSGPPSMEEWCEKLGVTATDEERMAMLQQVKAKSFEKKDLLTEETIGDMKGLFVQVNAMPSYATPP